MPQISLILNSLSADTIIGHVREAGTNKPIPGAQVRILPTDTSEFSIIIADSYGDFLLTCSGKLKQIDAAALGYRTLNVNLSSKKLF